MLKERAVELLQEMGIQSVNFYDKKTYLRKGRVHVGIFPVEAAREDQFYFSINGGDELFCISRSLITQCELEEHRGQDKYQVPLELADKIAKDEDLQELEDENFSRMTIRDFAAITWGKPISQKAWLNGLIIKNREHV